ncbi:MAG: phosphoribosylglycinamide formyltransferase [Pseudomonadota bacterium]
MVNDVPQKFNLVVLISGSGSNLQAIIDAVKGNKLDVSIKAVISNKEDAYGIQRANKAGIRTEIIDHKNYPDRETFDQQLIKIIDKYHPDLLVMAGFMRILSEEFINHFKNRMINIHPSLLPKFKGLHTHKRVLQAGEKEHGLTIHYVTAELDSGPILKQVKVPVFIDDTEETLASRVLEQEHIAYPEVIQWIANKKSSHIA